MEQGLPGRLHPQTQPRIVEDHPTLDKDDVPTEAPRFGRRESLGVPKLQIQVCRTVIYFMCGLSM